MNAMKIFPLALVLTSLLVACANATPSPTPFTAPTNTLAIPSATPLATIAPRAFTAYQQFALRDVPGAGRHPVALAMANGTLYALNWVSRNIAVLQNDRVARFIPLDAAPNAFVADPAQNRLFIATDDKMLRVFVNEQPTQALNIGDTARALLLIENRLFVGLDARGEILVLDPATLKIETRLTVPNSFTIIRLAGDATRHRVFANAYEKTAVIDSTNVRVISTITAKGSYQTLLADPPNDQALIGIYDSQTQTSFLTAFDPQTGKSSARVRLGGDPREAIANRDGSRVYVANSFTNDVSVIDPRAMSNLATIAVGLQPWSLALDENARRLYVGNYESDSISVINTDNNQVLATIPLAMMPTALAANESAGRVYLANASTDSVFVIEVSRVAREIAVGRHPSALVRDASSNRILVANQADRTLSIIDETTFAVRATQPITRYVTSVEVDAPRGRVFVNDVILDYNSLSPVGALTARGFTLNSIITPTGVRVNPNTGHIYATGSNGVPGSNSRVVTYSMDRATLAQRGTLSYSGNTAFLDLDPLTNRVFLAGTHPLAQTHELGVYDINDTKIFSLPLPARTTGMVFNPQTRHLFLAHAGSTTFTSTRQPTADNTIQVLDTDSFGEVARIALDAPGMMTRLGNTIYVATNQGTVALIQDTHAPMPPSPTPTFTSTPYPTLPPLTPRALATPSITRAPAVTTPTCALALGTIASQKWSPQLATRLGCATELERATNFATQVFEQGAMLWREDEKRIYVLFADKTWAQFDDAWNATLPEDSCPNIVAPASGKPKRGFGKVWCEKTNARAKLGLAISAEIGYAVPAQRFERGVIFASNPANRVWVLYANGTWE
ncbi:MAG: YncE family protein [Chloroflexi bacterium]|nr:YncE family protein [Chloroflexota bacterium]